MLVPLPLLRHPSSLTSPPITSRSVDSYWYPTAYARAVWSKVVDKPDTNNKATVPIEWRKKKKGRKQVQGQRIQVDSEENAEQAEAWKKVGF